MIETTEQIQNSVLPENPVAEVPVPSLTQIPAQVPAPESDTPQADSAPQDCRDNRALGNSQ